jgi:hypothetical protein
MQIWTSGGVALPARDDVPTLPGRESFVGEAPISTVWSFPPGFSNVLNLANGELWSVFAGTQTSSGMLAEIEAAARAALGQS